MSFCTHLLGRLFLSGPYLYMWSTMVLHDSLWSKVIENSATHIRINTQWLEAEPRFMNIFPGGVTLMVN